MDMSTFLKRKKIKEIWRSNQDYDEFYLAELLNLIEYEEGYEQLLGNIKC